ncbi:MAG: hypothetical protein CVT94_15270 [Bacteroidetes bacterium HGW-Bacteroidetes-11]|jgi:hypothetical protein|nr:MAG: hypothetical protein CVT94_15270 [Bacteroidetes bacterium HGW-Bacteroidetes-11]
MALKMQCFFVDLPGMKKDKINKEIIMKSVAKMVADKESVRSYIKGEITKKSLTTKGIKIAKPV